MSLMKTSLKSLAIINTGSSSNYADTLAGPLDFGRLNVVRSILLDNLLEWMFPAVEPPAEALDLERLWIHDFYVSPGRDRVLSVTPNLKAFRDVRRKNVYIEGYDTFSEHLEELGNCAFAPFAHLPNLKSANGQFFSGSDPQNLRDFIGAHQDLERLGIEYAGNALDYVPTNGLQLLKLKNLNCSCEITKDVVDDLARAYPNVEALDLQTVCTDMETRPDRDCLSAIRFQRLTSLGLESFNFQDGAFLEKIIEQNPKLERLYFAGTVSLRTPFLMHHLDTFLKKANKLRYFMINDRESRNDVSDILILLKFLLRCSSHLERVSLHFNYCNSPPNGDWGHLLADFLVEFVMKMERLTALSLVFHDIEPGFLKEANRRIAEKVIPFKPYLWFQLDNKFPDDPSVPSVHDREMVNWSGMFTTANLPIFVSPVS